MILHPRIWQLIVGFNHDSLLWSEYRLEQVGWVVDNTNTLPICQEHPDGTGIPMHF